MEGRIVKVSGPLIVASGLGQSEMYDVVRVSEQRLIGEIIDCGVDVLDPIQPVGPDMQPEALKREFGERLCFHGGLDMQTLLPHASPAEVTAQARRYCEVLGAGGGYILGPAHLFQPDVPPENVLAVYAQ